MKGEDKIVTLPPSGLSHATAFIPYLAPPMHFLISTYFSCLGQGLTKENYRMSMSCSSCKDKSSTTGRGCSQHEFVVKDQIFCPLYSRCSAGLHPSSFGGTYFFLLSQLPSLSLDYTSDMMASMWNLCDLGKDYAAAVPGVMRTPPHLRASCPC